MKAGRKAVMGMERIGSAMGLMRSWNQRKLAISSPRGTATTTHHKNACAIRHQLVATFCRRSLSLHKEGKARMTSSGVGTEKRLTMFQWVTMVHTAITMAQATAARVHLMVGETSRRMENKSGMG